MRININITPAQLECIKRYCEDPENPNFYDEVFVDLAPLITQQVIEVVSDRFNIDEEDEE